MTRFSGTLRSQQFPRWIGALVVFFGLLIIVSWLAHWRGLLQLIPNTAPTRVNTAVCFVFTGLGLYLLTIHRTRYVPWLGGAVLLLNSLTLGEYLTGHELGVDQLFLIPYFETNLVHPGRMSPLAATCFILVALELLLASVRPRRFARQVAAGLLPCIALAIAAVALAGYIFQIDSAYGWGAYSHMAVSTAAMFIILNAGLLFRAWQTAENYSLLRWLPVTGAVTIMLMVALFSAVNMADLKDATAWRKHTYQVIDLAQSFQEDDYIGMQRDVRGYVTLGDTTLLAAFQQDTNRWSGTFNQLVELTKDNPAQAPHLKAISDAVQHVILYDIQIIAAYQQAGSPAVLQMDATGRGRIVTGRVRDTIKIFTEEEKNLLTVRDAKEQFDYRCVKNLLIFGNTLSAILLVLANTFASRELLFRQRAEAKLQELFALQKAILDSSDYGIVSTTPAGIVQTFNPAAARMLGYSPGEIIAKETPMLWRDPQEIADRAQRLGTPAKPGFESLVAAVKPGLIDEGEWTFVRKDGSRFPSLLVVSPLTDPAGNFTGYLGVFRDISDRKKAETERELLIADLRHALAEVKTLSGLIPICGWCKSVRNDSGYWETVEKYVQAKTQADFTHGICPACQEKMLAQMNK